jgi:phenylpropionate dioxygenase-like ring-hydroxylating dioxygenase large terminal subunit
MRQTRFTQRLSQYTGIGARRVATTPPAVPGPVALPIGHPYLGLRNKWYMVSPSTELGDEPVAKRMLGEDLVLWRDGGGAPRLMEDYCPHRGARFSVGDVVEGELQCWYHSWRFDSDGQCTSIPTQGGKCSLQARTKIAKVYPVEEQAGFLWAWIGEEQPPELVVPWELTDPTYSRFPETVEWGTNWLLAFENVADVMHAPFLHNRSLTLNTGIVEDNVLVHDTASGFKVERQSQAQVNFDQVEFDLGDLVYCRLDIPLKPSFAGPGPPLRILGFATPIDDQRTMIHFPRCRQVDGWQRTLWRTLFRLRLRGTHLHVLNQDKAMLETLRSIPEAQRDEHLAQSDKPVLHLRRALREAFDTQVAELGPEWEGTAGLSGTRVSIASPSSRNTDTSSRTEHEHVSD